MNRITIQSEKLKPNYYALLLAIKKKISVAQACRAMDIAASHKKYSKRSKSNLTDEDLEEVIRLKKAGATWEEVGKKFGVKPKTLFQKVKRYMGDDWENRGW